MELDPLPSDEEIAAACAQGPEAVTALFQRAAGQLGAERRVINQGEIYWASSATGTGIAHPQVVVQENIFNHSRIHTVVVCALTTNRRRASAPGNVLLEAGEANLPKASVVEVSKIASVEKTQLGEYIGSLSAERIHQILAGIQFLQLSTEHPERSGDHKTGE